MKVLDAEADNCSTGKKFRKAQVGSDTETKDVRALMSPFLHWVSTQEMGSMCVATSAGTMTSTTPVPSALRASVVILACKSGNCTVNANI